MPDREKVIKDLDELYRLIYQSNVDGEILGSLHDAIALLKEQDNCENCAIAIEDRQPVVRCKDCKHSTVSENGLIKCGHTFRSADFFCADGEKKNDD